MQILKKRCEDVANTIKDHNCVPDQHFEILYT